MATRIITDGEAIALRRECTLAIIGAGIRGKEDVAGYLTKARQKLIATELGLGSKLPTPTFIRKKAVEMSPQKATATVVSQARPQKPVIADMHQMPHETAAEVDRTQSTIYKINANPVPFTREPSVTFEGIALHIGTDSKEKEVNVALANPIMNSRYPLVIMKAFDDDSIMMESIFGNAMLFKPGRRIEVTGTVMSTLTTQETPVVIATNYNLLK